MMRGASRGSRMQGGSEPACGRSQAQRHGPRQ